MTSAAAQVDGKAARRWAAWAVAGEGASAEVVASQRESSEAPAGTLGSKAAQTAAARSEEHAAGEA